MKHTFLTKDFLIPENVKVISFDIFDTLLLRPFEKPTDLFSFLSPLVSQMMKSKIDFRKLRKKAEKKARIKAMPREEVTLDEIYDNLEEIPVKLRGGIKFLEIKTELKLCFARNSGKVIYNIAQNFAQNNDVKIVATSDIYLPVDVIKSLLDKNQFKFDYIFCSSENKKTKKIGSLFKYILGTMKIAPSEMLHIGDNKISDIKTPKSLGIKTFYLPHIKKEVNKNLSYKNIFKGNKCLLSSISSSFIAEGIDKEELNPSTSSLFNGSLYKIGFNAFGSILLAYTHWMFKLCKKHNVKKLFFVARDGFIMHKAFQLLYGNKIDTQYLECSRRSLMSLMINTKKDVMHHFTRRYRNTSIREFILQKLECDPAKIEDKIQSYGFKSMEDKVKGLIFTNAQKIRLRRVVAFYGAEIFAKMQKEKPDALTYLQNSGILEDNVAICDVGYGGTTQKLINEIRGDEDIFGFYLITNHNAKNLKNAFGFLANRASSIHFKVLSSFVRLIESVIFSAPSGTVLGYQKGGVPIVEDLKTIELKRLEVSFHVWQGMLDFIILTKKRFGREFDFITYEVHSITKVFAHFCFAPTMQDASLLKGVIFENKSNAGGYSDLIENNLWKIGSLAVKKPKFFKLIKHFFKICLTYRAFF